MEVIDSCFIEYAKKHTAPESKQLRAVKKATEKELEYSDMMSGKIVGTLLKLFIRLLNAKQVLEIGTFVGYGTLSMAEALPEEGTITTIEFNERYIKIAKLNFKNSKDNEKIKLLEGEAMNILPQLEQTFDLVFLDADKGNYRNYLDFIIPILRTGGLLVVDNAYWQGEVWSPNDEKSESIQQTNQAIADDPNLEHLFLTVRDGLMIARKRG